MTDPVVPFDLARMFLGDAPPLFLLEIVLRTAVVYLYALLLIRWVGGRGIAQMSVVEFLLVIALGSAVGDAMFYPEVPILHAMLVITLVVLINKALDVLIFRYRGAERLLDGMTVEVIRDGVIDIASLRRLKLGQSELFEGMREAGIRNLGQVRRCYLETSGRFSFFCLDVPKPGLPVEPAWAVAPPPVLTPNTPLPNGVRAACCTCGTVLPPARATPETCPHCDARRWTRADLAPPAGG